MNEFEKNHHYHFSSCPKTALWLNNNAAMNTSDPIHHQELSQLVFPVMIHGERNTNALNELKDLIQWRLTNNVSPMTR